MKNLQAFWENCDQNFAHLTLSRHLSGYEKLCSAWEREFISKINFKDKRVIDYGLGGGHLGKYLFDKKEISHYYGIDISNRSLKYAEKNLTTHSSKLSLIDTNSFYSTFKEKADIFVSQACIQHFPNMKYLTSFLNKINLLECDTVMLQIRYGKTLFKNISPTGSLKESDIVYACHTNPTFVSKHLTKYSLDYSSKVDATSKYQFLIFKKK